MLVDQNLKHPFVSILILNFNGKILLGKLLDECLSSVLDSCYPNFEVVFVDNGSTDNSTEYVRKHFGYHSRLKIVQLKKNHGFAKGNNYGARYVDPRTEYLIFLNNDTTVEPYWIEQIMKVASVDPSIAVLSPKILLMDHKEKLAGIARIDYLGFGADLGGEEVDLGQYDNLRDVFSTGGAALVIRKDSFDYAGRFDPDYFFYFEDVDLCWRIRIMGLRIVFVPKSIVYHKWGGSSNMASDFAIYHHERNRLSTLLKNYERKNLLKYFPATLLIEVLQFLILSLLIRKKGLTIAHSLIDVLSNFKSIYKKRLFIQNCLRRVSDKQIMEHMAKPSLCRLLKKFRKFRYVYPN